MSSDHKAALATGRSQSAAVRKYLEALAMNKPKPGRKRTRESIETRLAAVIEELPSADVLRRAKLLQERKDLEKALASDSTENRVDLAELEAGFVANASAYAASKGISYGVWREMGVPASVLTEAGIRRARG